MSNQRLDQFAEAISTARATGTFGDAESAEQQLLGVLKDLAPELDHTTVGAAWLLIGNLLRNNLDQAPAHLQGDAAINLMNLVQLAGQRLYAGAPLTLPCPIPRSNGTACRFTAKGAQQETVDAMMRAHVDVYHPAATWPPAEDDVDERAAELAAKQAVGQEEYDKYHEANPLPDSEDRRGATGVCQGCGLDDTLTAEGVLCDHTTSTFSGVRLCPGSGYAPLALPHAEILTPVEALPEAAIGRCEECRHAVGVLPSKTLRPGFMTGDGSTLCDRCALERGAVTVDQVRAAYSLPPLTEAEATHVRHGVLTLDEALEVPGDTEDAAPRTYTLDEAMAHPGGIDALTDGAIRHGGFSVEGDDEQPEDGE
jgi:hypothetical protein